MRAGGPPPVICCDLDGVVWRGDEPVPGSSDALGRLRDAGIRVAYLSNNSSQTRATLVAKLERLGIGAATDDVLTSAIAAATLLGRDLSPGSRVLVCAGDGVVEALVGEGLTPVDEPPADAVVVGWHLDFDYAGLERASRAVREGARFVATNLDPTYPIPGGMLPGAGSIVAAVATAAGARPEVAGKPERPTVELVRAHLGDEGIVIGDRPSTDGALADGLGWPFALVLSGVTAATPPPGGEGIPTPPPPFVADDLAALVPLLLDGARAGPVGQR
jgi:4-nitrophenyl phosphatase